MAVTSGPVRQQARSRGRSPRRGSVRPASPPRRTGPVTVHEDTVRRVRRASVGTLLGGVLLYLAQVLADVGDGTGSLAPRPSTGLLVGLVVATLLVFAVTARWPGSAGGGPEECRRSAHDGARVLPRSEVAPGRPARRRGLWRGLLVANLLVLAFHAALYVAGSQRGEPYLSGHLVMVVLLTVTCGMVIQHLRSGGGR